jgi:hypothetical protein
MKPIVPWMKELKAPIEKFETCSNGAKSSETRYYFVLGNNYHPVTVVTMYYFEVQVIA